MRPHCRKTVVCFSMSDEQRTTRFLFPSQPQQAVHAVFESTKHQQGAPGFKEKMRQASLPPLKSGARGGLVAPGSKPSSLACYKHYDVQLDWSEVRLMQLSMLSLLTCIALPERTQRILTVLGQDIPVQRSWPSQRETTSPVV